MSFSIFRGFLVIAFAGLVGTATAATIHGGPPLLTTPAGCSTASECGSVCASQPEGCVPYCSVDAAHAVRCGEWARAYKASGNVDIAQFGSFAPPSGGTSFGSPPAGDFGHPPPPPGGTQFGSPPSDGTSFSSPPLGTPFALPGQPQPGGDQPRIEDHLGITAPAQMGSDIPPLGRPDMRPGEPVSGGTPPSNNFQQLPTGTAFPGQGQMGQPMERFTGNQSMMGQQQGQPPFEGGQRPPGDMMGRPGTQTCNINGVEVQGRCEDMDKQSRRPMGIELGGGLKGSGPGGCLSPEECKAYCEKGDNKQGCEGFFKNFQSAPRDFQTHEQSRPEFQKQTGQSQEEFDKQRQEGEERFAKEQEEQQKRVQGQMLSQMKRGMQQMSRMITQMESRIKALQRRKVKIPEEVTAAMAKLKELVVEAQNINDPEEMGRIGPEIGEWTQYVNESFGGLERLAEFPRILAQANRMIRQFEAQVKRLETRVNARKLDVGDTLTEAKSLLSEMKSARDGAAAAAAQGDAESAFEQLQSGVFERGDEIGEKMFALEMVVQAPQRIAQKNRELRTLEARIKQLERKKQDMTEARALLADARARLATITGLTKQRPLPIEEIMGLVEELEDVTDQIREHIGETDQPIFKPFELELPAGLQIAPSSSGGGGEGVAQ